MAPLSPTDADELRLVEQVLEARSEGRCLEVRGGGTKRFYGGEPRGDVLDLRALSGVRSYEPTELVVTVRAGEPLARLEALLAERGQHLAFEPPRFAPGGTDQPGTIWAGTLPGGLFRSDDRGDGWQLNQGLWNRPERPRWFGAGYDHPGIHSILVDPRDSAHLIVGVSVGGLWITHDGGQTWDLGG